jgi:hypothetical protein
VWLDFGASHSHLVVDVTVSSARSTHTKARDQVNFVDVDGNDILKRRF